MGMPKRVKSKVKRRELATAVTSAEADEAICAEERFPENPVVTENDGVKVYSDLDEVRGGKGAVLTSEHFKLLETSEQAKSELSRICQAVIGALSSEIVNRVEAHTGRSANLWSCDRQVAVQPRCAALHGK